MREFKAIMWKELMQIQSRQKSVIVNSVCNLILIGMIGMMRLLSLRSSGQDTTGMVTNIVIYVSIMCSYMALLTFLRFWQEKSNKTIETLISMPIGVESIVLAKTLIPVLLACVIGFIDTSVMFLSVWILYGNIKISLIYVIGVQIMFTILVGVPYSIINAYAMWCMDLTYSKMVQGGSSFAYIAVLGTMFINNNSDLFYLPRVIAIVSGVLMAIALVMLIKFDKEKIVLRFLD